MTPLESPHLDDRSFSDLVRAARERIEQTCPNWTDRSSGDPGAVLLELFAFLTETLIYRVNRLPQKAYVEFLRLMGVTLRPPAAALASIMVRKPKGSPVTLPRGTRVGTALNSKDGMPIVFMTLRELSMSQDDTEAEVPAIHAEEVAGEPATITRTPLGASFTVRRPPIIAPTGDSLDLLVGVEAVSHEERRGQVLEFGGKSFRLWKEVEHLSGGDQAPETFVVDRVAGTITMGEAPRHREVHVWYRHGGGSVGNVAANTLTVLRDRVPGVQVQNPKPATGGRDAESVEQAMVRGPRELYSLDRAVTARDYELVAERAGGVSRARAYTKARLWRHAPPGTVQVVIVPDVPPDAAGDRRAGCEALAALESEGTRERIRLALDQRRPLGTTCEVSWARYKRVGISGRVVVHRGADRNAIVSSLKRRVDRLIAPVASSARAGWQFGEPLRIAHVYDTLLSEPGVRFADRVTLHVDDVPGADVESVVPDIHQPRTWYAGAGEMVFRSTNDGVGWEPVVRFPSERVVVLRPHGTVPGFVAALVVGEKGCAVHVSGDCGEKWKLTSRLNFTVDDMAWIVRDGAPTLVLATDGGLYDLVVGPEAVPNQILVDPADQKMGFYAVVASRGALGGVYVAAVARGLGGVYLSTEGGSPGTFRHIGLKGQDIRALAIQSEGPTAYLWAGVWAPETVGTGAHRLRLWERLPDKTEWVPMDRGWDGGSCRSFAFAGGKVYAGTHFSGIAELDPTAAEAAWRTSPVDSGLPILKLSSFRPIPSLGSDPGGKWIFAATGAGVYRRDLRERPYANCSASEFRDEVTLPETWLFCPGEHRLEAVTEGSDEVE